MKVREAEGKATQSSVCARESWCFWEKRENENMRTNTAEKEELSNEADLWAQMTPV